MNLYIPDVKEEDIDKLMICKTANNDLIAISLKNDVFNVQRVPNHKGLIDVGKINYNYEVVGQNGTAIPVASVMSLNMFPPVIKGNA